MASRRRWATIRGPGRYAAAAAHGQAGMGALAGASYAGAHWLPSFAVYWLTAPARSLAPP